MSKYTGQPTIRYVAYRDEYLLKDSEDEVRIATKLLLVTLDNKGWPPYYHENATKLKRFYDEYVVTKTLATNLKRKHRKIGTRIIVLAKR